jgi:predicted DNA-binding protein YlxM (UPF0122 family)
MIKKSIMVISVLSFVLQLKALEIYLADISIYPDKADIEITQDEYDITKRIYDRLLESDFGGLLTVKLLSNKNLSFLDDVSVQTRLDASEMCEQLDTNYIIYGSVKKTHEYYDATLRLFENERKEVRKSVYNKTATDEYELLTTDLADRYVDYLYSLLGYVDSNDVGRKTAFGGIGVYNGAGYWFPIGDWWNVTTGLFSYETGIKFITYTPLGKSRNFRFSLRPGIVVSYTMGMNKPNLSTSYYNTLMFKLPLDMCFEVMKHHAFILSAGPQLQVDVLYQQPLYDTPLVTSTLAFSLFGGLAYEHWFGEKKLIAVGINNTFDFTFYSTFFMDYKLQLYVINRIPVQNNKVRSFK